MRALRWAAAGLAAACLWLAPGGANAARFFVDNTLGEVAPEDAAQVAEPRPVQLIFQFQTNGAANARATREVGGQITTLVTSSGFFSEVSTDPVEGGAIISVTINNIPQEDAASQGFATGLTFGLRGTTVADYYVAAAQYVPAGEGETVSAEARHTLYTTIGRTDPPENTTQARNAREAVETLVRQMVTHLLNDIAKQPGFSGAAAPLVADDAAPASEAAMAAAATESAPEEAPAETQPAN